MGMKLVAALAAVFLLLPPKEEKLTWKNYEKFRAIVNVKPAELSWQQVEWRSTFWNGLVEAQAKDKPIFYWIYDGDPRGGC